MEILIITYIFIFGILFGSFSSVVISRLRHGKGGIVSGRSECPKCNHILGMKDLIPIFSFLLTGGKCRYCKVKIPYFYPVLELIFGIGFVLTAIFFTDISLISLGDSKEIIKLVFFLLFTFLTLIYVIYDILYLEIPDSILGGLIGISFGGLLLQNFGIIEFFPHLKNISSLGFWENLGLISLFISSVIGYYFIMLKGKSYKVDFGILTIIIIGALGLWKLGIPLHQTIFGSAFLGGFVAFLFIFLQIFFSNGRAMGGGDLRIAILMGIVLGISLSFWGIFISYLAGSIVGILVIIYKKLNKTYLKDGNEIPFGPFLAVGIYIAFLYGNDLSKIFL